MSFLKDLKKKSYESLVNTDVIFDALECDDDYQNVMKYLTFNEKVDFHKILLAYTYYGTKNDFSKNSLLWITSFFSGCGLTTLIPYGINAISNATGNNEIFSPEFFDLSTNFSQIFCSGLGASILAKGGVYLKDFVYEHAFAKKIDDYSNISDMRKKIADNVEDNSLSNLEKVEVGSRDLRDSLFQPKGLLKDFSNESVEVKNEICIKLYGCDSKGNIEKENGDIQPDMLSFEENEYLN